MESLRRTSGAITVPRPMDRKPLAGDHHLFHGFVTFRMDPDPGAKRAVSGDEKADQLRASPVPVVRQACHLGFALVILAREERRSTWMGVDVAHHEPGRRRLPQSPRQRAGACRDMASRCGDHLVQVDGYDLAREVTAPRGAAPGICIHGTGREQQQSCALLAGLAEDQRPKQMEVVLAQGEARAHQADTSAASTRRSTVRIPSLPGRHSVLWRLQRCQVMPWKA